MRRISLGCLALTVITSSPLTLAQTENETEDAAPASSSEKDTPTGSGPSPGSPDDAGDATAKAASPTPSGTDGRDGSRTASSSAGQFTRTAGGLTSDEAARKALELSPEAGVSRAKVDSAHAQVDQVTWQYIPRLTLTASYTRLSPQPAAPEGGLGGSLVVTDQTQPGPLQPGANLIAVDATQAFQQVLDQWYLNAGLIVPLSDYIFNVKNAVNGARTAVRAAELTEKAERVKAAANARIAYYNWVGTKLQAQETEKSLERAKKQYETITAQFEAGRASRADVLRADAFVAQTELDKERARTGESIAREQLNVMMTGGEAGAQPDYKIGEDIMTPLPAGPDDQKSIEELQKEATIHRLEVRALRETQTAMKEKESVDRSGAYPRIEAFGNLTYANPNQRIVPQVPEWNASWDVGVRAVWTVNDIGIKRAEVKKTQAESAELLAQQRSIEYGLRTEVVSAYQGERGARLSTKTAERGLKAAEAAYQDRVLLYENGRATSLDLLEAETSLVGARLNLVQAHVALRNSHVRLRHALGRDARELYPETSDN